MLKNYITSAVRNILRHKTFSFVNIIALALGMSVCIVIMLYIQSELAYDKFNKDYKKVFRIAEEYSPEFKASFKQDYAINSPAMLKDILLNKYPEVAEAARVRLTFFNEQTIKFGNEIKKEKNYLSVDPAFFDIFDYKFISGDKNTALKDPFSIALTEQFAERYFGKDNPINKIINLDGADYKVTALLQNPPENSHLKFDYLLPLRTRPDEENVYNNTNFATYVKLKNPDDAQAFAQKIRDLPLSLATNGMKDYKLFLQPLAQIHFESHSDSEFETPGSINTIYGLITLAFIVLILACINYMNLSTARSSARAMEIGLRKTSGADRTQIIFQFLMESILTAFASLLISILMIYTVIPLFNYVVGSKLTFSLLGNIPFILAILLFTVFTGLFAGSYPAFYLASMQPLGAIKAVMAMTGNKLYSLRRVLIVLQFTICSILIVSVFTVSQQINYIYKKELGYNKDQIITVSISYNHYKNRNNIKTFRDEIEKYPFVKSACFSSGFPLDITPGQNYFWEDPKNDQMMCVLQTDKNFIKTYSLTIKEGNLFAGNNEVNKDDGEFLLNEAAVKYMNLKEAVGTKLGRGKRFTGHVIGVVKDFHIASFHEKIAPLIIVIDPDAFGDLSIKLAGTDIPHALDMIKSKMKEMLPDIPFDYSFFDEQYTKVYKAEQKLSGIVTSFSILSLAIACLGLFGLIAFSIEKKKKEIGVRKILGAGFKDIVALLTKEYLILIIIAGFIAIPFSVYVMNSWLSDFAYRVNLSVGVFLLSFIILVIISGLTILVQLIKAANSNPVDAIKYE